jgi:hypothetical protein
MEGGTAASFESARTIGQARDVERCRGSGSHDRLPIPFANAASTRLMNSIAVRKYPSHLRGGRGKQLAREFVRGTAAFSHRASDAAPTAAKRVATQ